MLRINIWMSTHRVLCWHNYLLSAPLDKLLIINLPMLTFSAVMKKFIFPLIILTSLLFGCGQKKKEAQILSLQADSLRLEHALAERDSMINMLFSSFNEIEDNLAAIRAKESLVTKHTTGSREIRAEVRERINDNIKDINDLLERNKNLIERLKIQLRTSNLKIEELNKSIERLNQHVEEKEQEIAELKQQLLSLNFKVESLNQKVSNLERESKEKSDIINEKVTDLNTAWYVVGTRRELLDLGIISREGGFIGIGRTTTFNKEFVREHFIQVDIRSLNEVELNVRKVEIVTTHAAGSFELVGESTIEKLVIKNPQEFWKASRYLVISTR